MARTCRTWEVRGTTVAIPRPMRSTAAFDPSLLTITAGRSVFASLPRDGSKSTHRTSQRRIVIQAGRGVPVPERFVFGSLPLLEFLDIGLHERLVSKRPDRSPAQLKAPPMTLALGPYDLLLDMGLAAVPVYVVGIAICVAAATFVLRHDDRARRRANLPPRFGEKTVASLPAKDPVSH